MQRMKMVLVCSAVMLMLAGPFAYGQTAAPGVSNSAPRDEQWEFRVTPYMWAPQIESKVTVGGYSTTINTYFSDIWRNLEAAGMVNLEAQKGKLGFFLNPLYMKIRGDGELLRTTDASRPLPPTRDITLNLTMGVLEFGGFYRLATWSLDSKQGTGRAVTLEALAGGRYWYIHMDLDTSSPINPTKYNDFVDPIIGGRTKVDLTDKLAFNLEGDIGGFGVGCDFTWNAQTSIAYQFTHLVSAFVGYRVLYADYKQSTGNRFQETFQGPTGGVTFRF
jgi:hypothetical protein